MGLWQPTVPRRLPETEMARAPSTSRPRHRRKDWLIMLRPFPRWIRWRAALAAALTLTPAILCANGDEVLGEPVDLTLAAGTGVVAAGTGLIAQPGTLSLTIPDGAQVKQVLLYWEQRGTSTDDTIAVNGHEIQGDLIGTGAAPPGTSSSFRADITGLGLVAPGANTLTVSGLNPPIDDEHRNDGASVVAIIDDGSRAAGIQIRDGNDFAFHRLPAPQDTTVPQTFQFDAAPFDRVADLFLILGDGTADRPDEIEISVGDMVFVLPNEARGRDGAEWDTVPLHVNVAAGITSVTVQCFSRDLRGMGGSPDSLSWVAAAFSLPLGPCTGEIGDLVWLDANGDGIQSPGEDGLAGVKVVLSTAGGQILATSVTDAHGSYLFPDLCAGRYKVHVDRTSLPPDVEPCDCEVGGDRSLDGNCQPAAVSLATDAASDLTIDFCHVEVEGGEGCTPGYWKQPHHFDSWPEPYEPTDLFTEVFGSPLYPRKTLLQILKLKGGKVNALARHAVAALLNAASEGVSYDLGEDEVIDAFNEAVGQGKKAIERLKNRLERFNEQGCPLH
jgi:hypothetical protein